MLERQKSGFISVGALCQGLFGIFVYWLKGLYFLCYA